MVIRKNAETTEPKQFTHGEGCDDCRGGGDGGSDNGGGGGRLGCGGGLALSRVALTPA